MATNFPGSLDTLTNPTSSDSLSSPSHSAQHANVNDAVEALQAKVGADSSAVTTSHDYKIAQLEALGTSTAYTPTISVVGGAGYTFTLNNAYYAQVNDLYVVWFSFAVTAGSGGGEFVVSLPTSRTTPVSGGARETAVNGLSWTGIGTGVLSEVKYSRYDNAGAVASGNNFAGFAIFGA